LLAAAAAFFVSTSDSDDESDDEDDDDDDDELSLSSSLSDENDTSAFFASIDVVSFVDLVLIVITKTPIRTAEGRYTVRTRSSCWPVGGVRSHCGLASYRHRAHSLSHSLALLIAQCNRGNVPRWVSAFFRVRFSRIYTRADITKRYILYATIDD